MSQKRVEASKKRIGNTKEIRSLVMARLATLKHSKMSKRERSAHSRMMLASRYIKVIQG